MLNYHLFFRYFPFELSRPQNSLNSSTFSLIDLRKKKSLKRNLIFFKEFARRKFDCCYFFNTHKKKTIKGKQKLFSRIFSFSFLVVRRFFWLNFLRSSNSLSCQSRSSSSVFSSLQSNLHIFRSIFNSFRAWITFTLEQILALQECRGVLTLLISQKIRKMNIRNQTLEEHQCENTCQRFYKTSH